MNFFERQHSARNVSVRLVVLFVLAVVLIVALTDAVAAIVVRNGGTSTVISAVIATSVITLLVIGGGTASKMIQLRAGGAAVAQSVGAVPVDPSTSDPRLRRFVNVVEEMAIASGVPTPRLFILESEPSINAFAAGYSPADAAITATAGALDKLNRDELQGVIGHEFSHVLNGDMRLNLRLIGLLNGILLLGLVGLRLLAFGPRDRRGGGGPLIAIAIAAIVLGFVGQFFAGLIKAGVSRQREWLADASSVQFTRQPTGLAGALKKIAFTDEGSALIDTHAESQINHMLFGEGKRGISQLYATHPPLIDRIKALEPDFDPSQLSVLREQWERQHHQVEPEQAASGSGFAPVAVPIAVTPASVIARVATVSAEDIAAGAALRAQLPAQLQQATTIPTMVVPLLLALLVDDSPALRAKQLEIIRARLGTSAGTATELALGQTAHLAANVRLPVVGMTAPMLLARPAQDLDAIVATFDELVAADNSISLFEYCLTRLVRGFIRDARNPAARSRTGSGTVGGATSAATALITALAAAGNADAAAAERAYSAAMTHLFGTTGVVAYAVPADLARALDAGWDSLDSLAPNDKQRLIEALVIAVRDDGVVQVAEADLLRVTCALLHCPLPALLS